MKRLVSKMLALQPNTQTYREMYEGTLFAVPTTGQEGWPEQDSRYFSGEIEFDITHTHRLAQDKPTVTIAIPLESLLKKTPEKPVFARLFQSFAGEGKETAGIRPHIPGPLPTAAADCCLRAFAPYIDALNENHENKKRTDQENGRYLLYRPGGEVLMRNSAYLACRAQKDYDYGKGSTVYLRENAGGPRPCLCLRLMVQLPRNRLKLAAKMLCQNLPKAVDNYIESFCESTLEQALLLAEKQAEIRAWMKQNHCCAFVANGSVLPRAQSGGAQEGATPFLSPPSCQQTSAGINGMAVRRGVTVITGGGYSGKSTLLNAIAAGIYNHAPGDGRELCLTDETAAIITAEDGRSIRNTDISPFIQWIPGGNPQNFSTAHASGSTSQAANIIEGLEGGARLLLIDEDRSATNFMMRDARMQRLIAKEPIVHFTRHVRGLSEKGVSTVLVIGGSGQFLPMADAVLLFENFHLYDVTQTAHALCGSPAESNPAIPLEPLGPQRLLQAENFTACTDKKGFGSERLEVSETGFVLFGNEQLNLRALHALATPGQAQALAFILKKLAVQEGEPLLFLPGRLQALYSVLEAEGLDAVYNTYFTACQRFLDLPRPQEVLAAVNRMKNISFVMQSSPEA